jgi:hypothetical protein
MERSERATAGASLGPPASQAVSWRPEEHDIARVQDAAGFAKKLRAESRNLPPCHRNGEDECQIVEGQSRKAHFPPVHARTTDWATLPCGAE